MRLEDLISLLVLHPTGVFKVGFHLLELSASLQSGTDHQKHSSVKEIDVDCNECDEHNYNESIVHSVKRNDLLKEAKPVKHLEIKSALDQTEKHVAKKIGNE